MADIISHVRSCKILEQVAVNAGRPLEFKLDRLEIAERLWCLAFMPLQAWYGTATHPE
jgi:hypothetical protein